MKQIYCTLLAAFLLGACTKDINSKNNEDLSAPQEATSSREAARGGQVFSTVLTGAQEVPGPGDPDGNGTATLTLNHGQGTITYEIKYSGIEPPRAAHIHEAPAGASGPVVVGLPLTNASNGFFSGTVSASRELIKEIQKNPSDYYVNVHNAPFPGGAIRGQLSK